MLHFIKANKIAPPAAEILSDLSIRTFQVFYLTSKYE